MSDRIVLLLSIFPQPSETFIVSKFLGLLDDGWDVQIVCSKFNQAGWDSYASLHEHPELRNRIHRGLPVHPRWLVMLLYLPVLLLTLITQPIALLSYFKTGWGLHKTGILRRFYLDAPLIRLRPDLIHFEFGSLAVGRETLAACLGCKMLVSFRGYDLNFIGLENANYYRAVWDCADAVHLLGTDLWKRAQVRGCPPGKPHALIPPAVDTDFFSPAEPAVADADAPSRPVRILSVGRLEWKKGYEFALQAVSLLKDRGIEFEYSIIGDGVFLEALAFARHQLGLDETVTFLGTLPHHKVQEQLCKADILLHPSLSEGFCNTVLEAQSMAVPVVCSDAGSLTENILNGVTGYVVPRRDPIAMADRLAALARDPALRARMGAAGRERVIQSFSPQQQIAAFSNLYRKILHGSL